MDARGMYGEHAWLYDRIYASKDYVAEAQRLVAILDAQGLARGARLVEAACGTGAWLVPLGHHYEVCGFDLSEPLLWIARQKLPTVRLWHADMTTFELDEPTDALVCLFSSIGHLEGEEALARFATRSFDALRPGGVLAVEPWIVPDALEAGVPWLQTHAAPDARVARASLSAVAGRVTTIDFQWLIARRGATQVEHLQETHRMWSWSPAELVDAFEGVGFEARYDPEGLLPGRGLLLGRRP